VPRPTSKVYLLGGAPSGKGSTEPRGKPLDSLATARDPGRGLVHGGDVSGLPSTHDSSLAMGHGAGLNSRIYYGTQTLHYKTSSAI
jgi:hypothetical protein